MLGAAGNRAPLCSVPRSLLGHGGDVKEGCLPISGHHPGSCLSRQPLDHIHPRPLALWTFKGCNWLCSGGGGGVLRGTDSRVSPGEPRLLLSASHNEKQYTRLLVQRGRR